MKEERGDGSAGPSGRAEDGVATETEGGEEWRERKTGWRRLRSPRGRGLVRKKGSHEGLPRLTPALAGKLRSAGVEDATGQLIPAQNWPGS